MRLSYVGRGKVGIIELDLTQLDLDAFGGLRFQPIPCECPVACKCVRALYFDGWNPEVAQVVIEQEEGSFYLLRSPETEIGHYRSESGTKVNPDEPVYCFPGRPPRAIMGGPVTGLAKVYRLPDWLRNREEIHGLREQAAV